MCFWYKKSIIFGQTHLLNMSEYKLKNTSFYTYQRLNLKELVLKRFKDFKSSEEFFKISPRPQNTCPMIDDYPLYILQKRLEELKEIEEISIPNSYGMHCDYCSNSRSLNEYISDASFIQKTVVNYMGDIEDAIKYIELLRTDCEKVRADGDELKELIWSLLDDESTDNINRIKELIELNPSEEFSLRKFNQFFDHKPLSNLTVYDFDHCENEDCPFNDNILNDLKSLEKYDLNNIFELPETDDAVENYNNLCLWLNDIKEKASEIIEDLSQIEAWKERIDTENYLEEFQNHFDQNYLNFWQKQQNIDTLAGNLKIPLDHHTTNLLNFFTENNLTLEHSVLLNTISIITKRSQEILEINIETDLLSHKNATIGAFQELLYKKELLNELISNHKDTLNYEQYRTAINKVLQIINSSGLVRYDTAGHTFIIEKILS